MIRIILYVVYLLRDHWLPRIKNKRRAWLVNDDAALISTLITLKTKEVNFLDEITYPPFVIIIIITKWSGKFTENLLIVYSYIIIDNLM